jgi:tripartite-type tricarboxylate transporter receptor subunit TctC
MRKHLLAVLFTSMGAFHAHAATWPSKPITFIVTYPPGGSADVIARMIAPKMSAVLGKPVIVENRAGGGGSIGVNAVARSRPDGYTIGLGGSGAFAMLPHLMKLPYSPTSDLAFVSLVATAPQVIAVNAKSEFKTLDELIAAAKKSPGKLNYGSAGNGTSPHLAAELFKSEAGINVVHISYKGASPAITDLIGGQIEVFIGDLNPVMPFLKSGALKALALTGPRRPNLLPNVPSSAEFNLPKVVSETNYGVVAPKAVPQEIYDKIQNAVSVALKSPEVRNAFIAQGLLPVGSTSAQYRAITNAENQKWGELIKRAQIKID